MNWVIIALINPIAHAVVNHFDKYLISRYVKGGSVGTLILFSALFAVVALPVIFFIDPSVYDVVSLGQGMLLMVNGALLVVAVMFYLYALADEEASFVAPFFQLVPVLGFVLGYFLLGEILGKNQITGGLLVVLGGIVLSFELSNKPGRFKIKLLGLMLGSSLFYATNAIVFKWIATEQGFLASLFWDMAGKAVFGLLLFATIAPYRRQFLKLVRENRLVILSLNSLNEIFALIGEVALVLAIMYAPVALVQSVGGLQPAFVFVFGVLITVFFPRWGKESLNKLLLLQKGVGIAVMTVGVYLLDLL